MFRTNDPLLHDSSGTFSTVYKAEDLHYDHYLNNWDIGYNDDKENLGMSPAGKKRKRNEEQMHYVAIKKIYVTSSPLRIMNELELLHDLKDSDSVCPLITAFRYQDQVIAVLPYFRHLDFRSYFREMTVADMRIYFRSLFTALWAVHDRGILHRDIKPTNFLYDTRRKRGVLVDFGLAEREGTDAQACLCMLDLATRERRFETSYYKIHGKLGGVPRDDRRPALRANRAGTRGFRAPEVLFKCTAQTTKIDVWSAGVILLTILARRFPFFNSADDIDAVVEIGCIFGRQRMKECARLHGQVFVTNIPSVQDKGYTLEKVIQWSNNARQKDAHGNKIEVNQDESEAISFLTGCLDLDPNTRMSAEDALAHPFLELKEDEGSEDEVDILSLE